MKNWWEKVLKAVAGFLLWVWSGVVWVFKALVNKVVLMNGLLDDLLVDASGWRNKLLIGVWLLAWAMATNWIYTVCATAITIVYLWKYDAVKKV